MRQNRLSEFLLTPFGSLYAAVVHSRKILYETGRFKARILGAPIVSVGNITVGGTGKTPLVRFVARRLAEKKHRVCVLTRGYKRADPNQRVLVSDGEQILADARASGDEPFELARALSGVAAVVADKDRFAAGVWAREHLGATAFVLDDGFQHWRLQRQLDIVAVDATNPFGNGKLLPAGILREPLESLRRADAIVLTRSDLIAETSGIQAEIGKYNPDCPILLARSEIREINRLADFLEFSTKSAPFHKPNFDRAAKIFVFCALGNPSAFVKDAEKAGCEIAAAEFFPDHYRYKQSDIAKIERTAKERGADVLLTTAKDAVKLKELKFDLPCFVAEAEVVFAEDEPLLSLLSALSPN